MAYYNNHYTMKEAFKTRFTNVGIESFESLKDNFQIFAKLIGIEIEDSKLEEYYEVAVNEWNSLQDKMIIDGILFYEIDLYQAQWEDINGLSCGAFVPDVNGKCHNVQQWYNEKGNQFNSFNLL